MHNDLHHITHELQSKGYRITDARLAILEAMLTALEPKTIRDIAKRVKADEASVYRTIAVLAKEGIAETITMPDGSQAYAIHEEHHHHLICTSCNKVVHLPCDIPVPEISLKKTGFKEIHDHEVTYYGLCKTCA